MRRCVHSRERGSRLEAAREGRGGRPQGSCRGALFDQARAELPGAAPAASSARIVDGQLVITLGKEWGETLSRIKSLAFYPFDDGVIEYAAPQTLSRRDGAVDLADEARLSAAAAPATFAAY